MGRPKTVLNSVQHSALDKVRRARANRYDALMRYDSERAVLERSLELELSRSLNTARVLGVPKVRIAEAMEISNFLTLQKIYDLTAHEFTAEHEAAVVASQKPQFEQVGEVQHEYTAPGFGWWGDAVTVRCNYVVDPATDAPAEVIVHTCVRDSLDTIWTPEDSVLWHPKTPKDQFAFYNVRIPVGVTLPPKDADALLAFAKEALK